MAGVPTSPTHPGRRTRIDLAVLAALAVALRLPAYLADRHVTFDDGVFGASAVAMRAGGQPFRDVFSSQGPLFLPLVWVGDLVGFRTTNSPRVIAVAAGLALVVVTYLAGPRHRRPGGRARRRGADRGVRQRALGVGADRGRQRRPSRSPWRPCTSRCAGATTSRRAGPSSLGLGIGATISVKALLAPVIVPVALVLLAGRRLVPIVAGAATAVAFHLALWLPWGPSDVWDQSYGYHLEVAGRPDARGEPGQDPQHPRRPRPPRAARRRARDRRASRCGRRATAPAASARSDVAGHAAPRLARRRRCWSCSPSTRCGARTCRSSSRRSRSSRLGTARRPGCWPWPRSRCCPTTSSTPGRSCTRRTTPPARRR